MRKIHIIHLLPAILSVSIGISGTLVIEHSQVKNYLEISFSLEDNVLSTIIIILLFFALILLGTVILLVLLKFKALSVINGMYFVLFLITGLFLYQVYIMSLISLLNIFINENIIWIISIIFSLITSFIVLLSKKDIPIFITLTLYGGLLGPVFRLMLPLWSAIILLIIISIYDMYSVLYGPLKQIIETLGGNTSGKSLPPIRGALIPLKGINLGIGDVVFYSLLASISTVYPTLSASRGLMVAALIITGYYLTLKLVKKRGYAPALPLPVTLGLIGLLIGIVIGIR